MTRRLTTQGQLLEPFFGARPIEPTLSYRLNVSPPRRPDPELITGSAGQAEPDRLQHAYADRVYTACLAMTGKDQLPHPLSHGAVSLRLDAGYDGPLVSTYKVVQDVLDRRARVLARDDNSRRVPELHVCRDLPVTAGNVVTVVDLTTDEMYSREFLATPQPHRVATDAAHTFNFEQDTTRTPSDYFAACAELGSLMVPVAAAHPPVGHIPDHTLKGATLTIVVHGLSPKRDLDNCVLAVLDVVQATREHAGAGATSVDRLIGQVHAYTLAGPPSVELDIQTPFPSP